MPNQIFLTNLAGIAFLMCAGFGSAAAHPAKGIKLGPIVYEHARIGIPTNSRQFALRNGLSRTLELTLPGSRTVTMKVFGTTAYRGNIYFESRKDATLFLAVAGYKMKSASEKIPLGGTAASWVKPKTKETAYLRLDGSGSFPAAVSGFLVFRDIGVEPIQRAVPFAWHDRLFSEAGRSERVLPLDGVTTRLK